MWTRRANLWSCPNGSLLYWQPTRYCWVLGRCISEWCLHSILDFSIYLFDLPLSICRTSIMVSFVNPISCYSVSTNLTIFKVVVRAGPWSVWSQLILIRFKWVHSFEHFLAVIDFTFENTMRHHFWIRVDVANSNLSNAMVSGLSVSSLMNVRLIEVLFCRDISVSTVLNRILLAGTAS
jgi:hypothetical protein